MKNIFLLVIFKPATLFPIADRTLPTMVIHADAIINAYPIINYVPNLIALILTTNNGFSRLYHRKYLFHHKSCAKSDRTDS